MRSLIVLFIALTCFFTQAQTEYEAFMIDTGFGACSAFAIKNEPNSDQDVALTAAHCFDPLGFGQAVPIPATAEWGGQLRLKAAGTPGMSNDVAVIIGSIPESFKPIPIAKVQPSFPFDAYFLGFNILNGTTKGFKDAIILGLDEYGALKGRSSPRPGNSGGPLIHIDSQGNHWLVGITFAYDIEDHNIGYFVPLKDIHEVLSAAFEGP